MKLGLFTALLNKLGFEGMLAELKRYPQIEMLEIGTGGWPGASHLPFEKLRCDASVRQAYAGKLAAHGLRSWIFRSVGWGHGELEWKQIVSALRLAKYDGVLSIKHEDALASTDEGLSSAIAMLSRVLLKDPPVDAWWA